METEEKLKKEKTDRKNTERKFRSRMEELEAKLGDHSSSNEANF